MPMCPDREILSAFLDGEIASPWDRAIESHVAGCPRCTAVLAGHRATRRVLREEPPGEWQASMERVRQRILSQAASFMRRVPIWKRHVSVPAPLAALAAAILITLGVTIAVLAARSKVGYVRITNAPGGSTEYQFAVPYDKVESLLKSVGGSEANVESVMTLPKNVKLVPVGEPRMGKATEFPRKKP
jgi:hypothetical protein